MNSGFADPACPQLPVVMAIVNRTPDSFYDQGATFVDEKALERVAQAVAEGARIIDIGGVKAGPGTEVSVAEEIDRVVPTIAAAHERFPEVALSVDTWRSPVAEAALRAGAALVNDTWSGHDPELVEVAGKFGAGYVCSHTGGAEPRTLPFRVHYDDIVADVIRVTTAMAERAVRAGVPEDRIFLDPTHDFGKNTFHGLELLRRTHELVATGWPILMALSNKGFVGETLDRTVFERFPGTLAATVYAADRGVAAFRCHEVRETLDALYMTAAIQGHVPPRKVTRGVA